VARAALAVPADIQAISSDLPQPGPQRSSRFFLIQLAIIVALSAASVYYYRNQHLIIASLDSFSHLETSRRVVSGLSPGIAQLGDVWLPVPQLLASIFSWSSILYHSGLAGSLVSMGAYVTVAVYLYRVLTIFTKGRPWPAAVGALVFALNVNVLYLQSTPTDELPFYAFTTAAVYYLVRWGDQQTATDLLRASAAALLAALCRYEGWFLAVVYIGCAACMARKMGYSWRDVRGLCLIPGCVALLAPLCGWLLYSWLLFGSPVAFLSPASHLTDAPGQIFDSSGGQAIRAYLIAMGADLGVVLLTAAVVGVVVFVYKEKWSPRSFPVLASLLIIPFFFYIVGSGIEPLSLPQQGQPLLNYQFGLVVIIPCAILIGYTVDSVANHARARVALGAAAILAVISGVGLYQHQVVLAVEAAQDVQNDHLQVVVGNYLYHHTSGSILLDTQLNEIVDYNVIDRTIYDGTKERGQNQWIKVLANPGSFDAQTIVMRGPTTGENSDAVYDALYGTPKMAAYHLVYSNESYLVYQRS
jgi:hypothetical protein